MAQQTQQKEYSLEEVKRIYHERIAACKEQIRFYEDRLKIIGTLIDETEKIKKEKKVAKPGRGRITVPPFPSNTEPSNSSLASAGLTQGILVTLKNTGRPLTTSEIAAAMLSSGYKPKKNSKFNVNLIATLKRLKKENRIDSSKEGHHRYYSHKA